MKPLIDRRRYNKVYEYFYEDETGNTVRAIGKPRGMGGAVSMKVLSDTGLAIRKKLIQFASGRAPTYNGLSSKSIYFKWVLHAECPIERDQLFVAADWVRDLGYSVEVTEYKDKTVRVPDKSKPKLGEHYPGGRTWWQRKEIPCTYVKVLIYHPEEFKL